MWGFACDADSNLATVGSEVAHGPRAAHHRARGRQHTHDHVLTTRLPRADLPRHPRAARGRRPGLVGRLERRPSSMTQRVTSFTTRPPRARSAPTRGPTQAGHLPLPQRHPPGGAGADGPVRRDDHERRRPVAAVGTGPPRKPPNPALRRRTRTTTRSSCSTARSTSRSTRRCRRHLWHGAAPTSTIDYAPRSSSSTASRTPTVATPPLAGGTAGQRTLLRLLNAGLKSHAPTARQRRALDRRRGRQQVPLRARAGRAPPGRGKDPRRSLDAVLVGCLHRLRPPSGLNAEGQGSAGMLAKLSVVGASPSEPPPRRAPPPRRPSPTPPRGPGSHRRRGHRTPFRPAASAPRRTSSRRPIPAW